MRRRGTVYLCRIGTCYDKVLAKGYCAAHYRRIQKFGKSLWHIPIKKRVWGSSLAKTPEFRTWTQMNYRCNNPKSKDFKYYGARGIKVCARWKKFENFLEDMGKKPKGKSIDRINNNCGYSPHNCRWATQKEQLKNRRPMNKWTTK